MHTHGETFHKVQAGELWLTYLLYALLITAPVGILLSVIKSLQYRRLLKQGERDSAEVELLLNHYTWLNRTALVTAVLVMTGVGTAYYFFGYLFGIAAVMWWLYRIGRGVVALIEYKAPPAAA